MAITVKFLTEECGLEKDVAEKIFAERDKEIQAEKEKLNKTAEELTKANEQIETMTADMKELKENNASAEDYKKKWEETQTAWDNEKAETKKAQLEAEKKANIDSRFAVAVGDKKFTHPAIEKYIREKFGEEIDKADGRGDAEILTALTKDDAQAFVGNTITTVNLAGAKPIGTQTITGKDFAKMGYKDRVNLFNTNKPLYDELSGNTNKDTE